MGLSRVGGDVFPGAQEGPPARRVLAPVVPERMKNKRNSDKSTGTFGRRILVCFFVEGPLSGITLCTQNAGCERLVQCSFS